MTLTRPKIEVPPVGEKDCLCGRPGVVFKRREWVCATCSALETQAAGFQRRKAMTGRREKP